MTIQRPDDLPLVVIEIDVKIIDRATVDGPRLIKTACDGEDLTIECPGEKVIKISDANFGRIDKTTCPSNIEDQNEDADCRAANSLGETRRRCQGKSSCTLPGDFHGWIGGEYPCPGTAIYMQVEYTCAAAGPRLPLKDCAEAHRFGRHADETLTLKPDPGDPAQDYTTACTDGWTTILRRSQDSGDPVFFDRDLEDFVDGFGSPDTEYFMGLSRLEL